MKLSRWFLALSVVGLGLAVSLLFGGCGRSPNPWGETGGKKRVLTSIVPLHCFAANIAGEDAEVRCLLTTRGPHDFAPSPYEAKLLSGADLFIVNGLGLEDFLDGLVRSSGNRRMMVLKAGEKVPKDRLIEASGVPHYHGDKLVVHKGIDPHVWLGMEEAIIQCEAIRDALIEIDPAHAANYRSRAEEFIQKLKALKEKNQSTPNLGGGLVTFHDSFRYFGRSFNVPIAGAIRGLKGEEISAGELRQQAKQFREADVRIIGVEPQYPRQVAENLGRTMGSGVQVIELDPLETGPPDPQREFYVDKDWYLQRMAQNLDNIKKAASASAP